MDTSTKTIKDMITTDDAEKMLKDLGYKKPTNIVITFKGLSKHSKALMFRFDFNETLLSGEDYDTYAHVFFRIGD